MTTIHLSDSDALTYRTSRPAVLNLAQHVMRRNGKRFAQIVAPDGRILDVCELSR